MEGIRPPKNLVIPSSNEYPAWKAWYQQFKFFATASELNKKDESVQAAIFMNCIGPSAYRIYETFKLKDDELKLEDIVNKFETHFKPKENITYERYVFNSIVQKPGQSFDDFLQKCKLQIINCKFESLEEDLLRDRIVVGVKSQKLRELLLIDDKLTLEKAIDTCRANEMALKQISSMAAATSNQKSPAGGAQKQQKQKPDTGKNETGQSKEANKDQVKQFFCKKCKSKHGPKQCPAFGKVSEN